MGDQEKCVVHEKVIAKTVKEAFEGGKIIRIRPGPPVDDNSDDPDAWQGVGAPADKMKLLRLHDNK